MVAMGKKEKLLEVQKEIHELQLLMLKFDDIKIKRDKLFLNILRKLGKIAKVDLIKKLDEDRTIFYERERLSWTTDNSIEWLNTWFDETAKKVK
jgi:hypothetical protein